MRIRALAATLCSSLALSGVAQAQVALIERVRIQGGFISEQRPAPFARIENVFIGAIPELSLVYNTPRTQSSLTYNLSAALHSAYPNQLAHTGTLATGVELSPRATLIASTFVSLTSASTLLLNQPVSGATFVPRTTSNEFLLYGLSQGIGYQVSENVRAEQHLTATYYGGLGDAPSFNSFGAVIGGSAERVWEHDGVGPEASVGMTTVSAAPPFRDQDYLLVTGGGRWRHDWSESVSSLLAVGVASLSSPNDSARSLVAPFARGSVQYLAGNEIVVEANASTSLTPNPLTGQALRAHQVGANLTMPVVPSQRIYGTATVGYVRGTLLESSVSGGDTTFNSMTTDVGLVWRLTPLVELFARYTFFGQIIDETTVTSPVVGLPSFLRDSFLVGIGLQSEPPGARRGRNGGSFEERGVFPQRVDRGDGQAVEGGGEGVDEDGRPRPRAGPGVAPPPPIGGGVTGPAPTGGARVIQPFEVHSNVNNPAFERFENPDPERERLLRERKEEQDRIRERKQEQDRAPQPQPQPRAAPKPAPKPAPKR